MLTFCSTKVQLGFGSLQPPIHCHQSLSLALNGNYIKNPCCIHQRFTVTIKVDKAYQHSPRIQRQQISPLQERGSLHLYFKDLLQTRIMFFVIPDSKTLSSACLLTSDRNENAQQSARMTRAAQPVFVLHDVNPKVSFLFSFGARNIESVRKKSRLVKLNW